MPTALSVTATIAATANKNIMNDVRDIEVLKICSMDRALMTGTRKFKVATIWFTRIISGNGAGALVRTKQVRSLTPSERLRDNNYLRANIDVSPGRNASATRIFSVVTSRDRTRRSLRTEWVRARDTDALGSPTRYGRSGFAHGIRTVLAKDDAASNAETHQWHVGDSAHAHFSRNCHELPLQFAMKSQRLFTGVVCREWQDHIS